MARSCRRLCVLVAVFTVAAILALTACDGVRASSPTQQEMMGGWQCGPEAYHPSRVIVRFAGNTMTTAAATGTIQSLGYSLQSTVVSLLTLSVLMILRLSVIEFRPWIAGRDESTTGSQNMGTAAAKR